MDPKTLHTRLADAAKRFHSELIDERGGRDPVAALYAERRAAYSLFSLQLSDADCEALRPYLFGRPIPRKAGDKPVSCLNLVDGEWRRAAEMVPMKSLADRRVTLFEIPRSREAECKQAIDRAHAFWSSLEWTNEGLAYRKHVVKNFSRLLHYFYEECLDELRQQTPKTRLEADKDFWEAKRAADHLEGNAEKAMRGEIVPTMIAGQEYWKDAYIPAGVCTVITPMNFIYGIPGIQIVGCYLAGAPMIFKGHPFSAITSTTMIKMLLAAGADPRVVHKLEGFGGDIAPIVEDERIAVVSVTGSAETAKVIQAKRGVRPVKFEGGGCNWSWIDDGFSDEELKKIAVRLSYSKLGLGSHKCTSLHGIAASRATLDKIEPMIVAEMKTWKVTDPRATPPSETKIVGPVMVHKASTVQSIQDSARAAGVKVLLEGGKQSGSEWAGQRRGGGAGDARARDAGDEARGRLGRQGEDDRPGAHRVLHAHPRHDGDGELRRLRAVLREREPARPGDEPLDPRRREALDGPPHPRRDAQGKRRHRQCARVGRSSGPAAWATAATPASAMPRRRLPCSAGAKRAGISCSELLLR